MLYEKEYEEIFPDCFSCDAPGDCGGRRLGRQCGVQYAAAGLRLHQEQDWKSLSLRYSARILSP